MKNIINLAVLSGCLILGSIAKADVCTTSTNLVANCGFETGSLSSWLVSPSSEAGNWFGVDSFDAYTGSYGAYLAGFGSYSSGDSDFGLIGQDIATVVGKTYVLTYDLAHNTLFDPTATPDDYFAAGINGTILGGSQEVNVGSQAFTPARLSFVATSATTLIEFEAEDANFYFSLDDVSVSLAPEPASFAFVASALIGLGVFFRLRKQSA